MDTVFFLKKKKKHLTSQEHLPDNFILQSKCPMLSFFLKQLLKQFRPKAAPDLLENPKASLPGRMKEPKSSANSPRLFSMYGLAEDEDDDEEDEVEEDEVWWKLRSDR